MAQQVWQADDGTCFGKKQEALRYEAARMAAMRLKRLVEIRGRFLTGSEAETAFLFCTMFAMNAKEAIQILQDAEREYAAIEAAEQ